MCDVSRALAPFSALVAKLVDLAGKDLECVVECRLRLGGDAVGDQFRAAGLAADRDLARAVAMVRVRSFDIDPDVDQIMMALCKPFDPLFGRFTIRIRQLTRVSPMNFHAPERSNWHAICVGWKGLTTAFAGSSCPSLGHAAPLGLPACGPTGAMRARVLLSPCSMYNDARSVSRLAKSCLALLGALACAGTPAPPSEQVMSHPFLIEQGASDFAENCAACHGLDGRGGGPAAAAMIVPPADLTRIAARRDGTFPRLDVAYVIDGRFELKAHGSREMPVWGRRFLVGLPENESGDAIVRGRIEALVEYLESIQVSPE